MPNAIQRLKEHPTGFWFIFWGELAERASYYGMRTVLALYLTTVLHYDEADGAAIMTGFMACCYVTPLLGGYLADRFLGRYKTILYFSGPYILGHIILGGFESRIGLFSALVLLALGSGSIKPNTSTLMGQMYEEQKKDSLLTEAFSYFYAAINIGSTVTTFALPKIRDSIAATGDIHKAYAVTLAIPAVLMAAAFMLFAAGKKHYPKEDVRSLPAKTPEQKAAEWATLGRIAGLFSLLSIWWFVYDQSASTWIYFADKHMDMTLFGSWKTTPDSVQGFNPLFIVLLTPMFNWMWLAIKQRRGGIDLPDTRKMFIGFIIVLVCMGMMAICGYAGMNERISIWWLIIATFVITLSELCVSVIGLEFAFRVALPGTKSVVTGAFYFTIFAGDTVGTIYAKWLWGSISPGAYFAIQTAITAVTAAAFYFVARKFERDEAAHSG